MIESVERSSRLAPTDVAAVLRLASAAEAVDRVAALSEQTLLRLDDPAPGVLHLVVRFESGGPITGYAQLDGEATADLVVDPAHRRLGLGGRLLDELRGAIDSRSAVDSRSAEAALHVWAHGDLPGAAALATREGYNRSRVLLQLRRSLHEPLPDPQFLDEVTVRAFQPGADEAAWLAVNNAAFASHPEQGRWTLHDVAQREAQSWFDPAGLFLAERDGELVGFHWTKVHAEETPPIGEVYVVGVRPEDGGRGLGPALTLVGLHHLRSLGLAEVLLYVDEDNQPAMKTYARLGFTRWATDVLYAASSPRRNPSAGTKNRSAAA